MAKKIEEDQIDVGAELEKFKTKIVPLLTSAELQALVKFLKSEIDLRESAQPKAPDENVEAMKTGMAQGRKFQM